MRFKRMYSIYLWIPILLLSLSSCSGKGLEIPIPEKGGLKIISNNGYLVIGFPGLYRIIVGEVQNTGDTNLRSVMLVATFSDSDGEVLSTGRATTLMGILLPGEKSPFYFAELTGKEVKQYILEIDEFRETDSQPYRDFEIVNHSSKVDDQGEYHVIGQIKNTGTEDAKFTEVFATFYGADGEVVAVGFISVGTEPWLLSPGESASFDLVPFPDEATSEIVSYILQVDCAFDPGTLEDQP